MSFPGAAAAQGCSLSVAVFDGARQPMTAATDILYTVRDGNQKTVFRDFRRGALLITALPFFDNFGDNYTVIAFADDHEQAGFTPVRVAPNAPQRVDLMLLKKDAGFNFSGATWAIVQARRKKLAELLAADVGSAGAARDRYRELTERKSNAVACLLNITTAMEQIHLRSGSPLDCWRRIDFDASFQQDRFFGYADRALIGLVEEAARAGVFAPEPGSFLFHPGATSSYKQVQFGEANVQITFHDEDRKTVDGVECCKVEADIDYEKDVAAHALLEVIPNAISGGLTDPRQVYVLRWIAGRRAGVPEFDPLYTIV